MAETPPVVLIKQQDRFRRARTLFRVQPFDRVARRRERCVAAALIQRYRSRDVPADSLAQFVQLPEVDAAAWIVAVAPPLIKRDRPRQVDAHALPGAVQDAEVAAADAGSAVASALSELDRLAQVFRDALAPAPVLRAISRRITLIKVATQMTHTLISVDPAVMVGKPVIRGTRIIVDLVVRKFSEGATEDDLLDAYPHLTREGIRAALAYAADAVSHEELFSTAATQS